MAAVSPEDERRALAIFERLSERPGDLRARRRLMGRETAAVCARVEALEQARRRAEGSLPTTLPGELLEPVAPPGRVGAYRLTHLLGEGGMGQVWEGERDDGLFEQRVAVKLIRPHLARLGAKHFDAERRILARLEHPGIARLIDGGATEAGAAFLVMEHVVGVPLDAAAEGRPLAARVRMFRAAAEAVQFAHEKLVVHADLKPSNMLVDAGGRVRLLDFGIARLIGAADAEPLAVPMTRGFASPARAAGEPPSIADDVHALGVTLELIAGADADADLLAVIGRARAAEEKDRYGSVAALVADLERWQQQLPVSAQPDSFWYRARKFGVRHRVGVAATAVVFVLLAVAASVATVNYVRAERARAEAVARFADARAAARFLQYNVVDRLERLPHSLPLRADIAEVSQTYLDRLAASPAAPDDVRLESAEGLMRLAERQGAPARPNLGKADAARASYKKALAALVPVSGPAADRLRARILIGHAGLEADSFNDFAAAEALLVKAGPLVVPDGAPAVALKSDYLASLSLLRQWQGRYEDAIRLGDQAEAAAVGQSYAAMAARARAAQAVGDALYYTGRMAEGLDAYQRQLGLLRALAAQAPDDLVVRRNLGIALWSIAATLLDSKRAAEALPYIVEASRYSAAAAARQPEDAAAQRQHNVNENVRAQVLGAMGRTDEALAILQASAARRRALWQALPADVSRLRDYAVNVQMIADIEADAGRTAAACARYAEVVSLGNSLAKEGRLSPLDQDTLLKSVRARQATHCGVLG